MVQVKDEDKHLELVRWAVIRTKFGHGWKSPYTAGGILFVVETEEGAEKLLKEAYEDCLSKYPELRESDHYISEHGGFAFAGDPKTFGIELHIQRIPMPLTDKEIETPICKTTQKMLAVKKLGIVPILRAGLGMVDGVMNLAVSYTHLTLPTICSV